ncbi:restriction endonuclease subunit S [Staphylococcus cohnii]|nr:restriction endonuclease subunit S [Staphylococcus cohnii]
MTNEVKNVPELRFPEFDEEWEKKRLKDICKINPKFEDNFPSEFNYIDLESVKKGKIYKISKYTMHNAPSRAQRVAKQGDIFFQTVRPYQQNNFVFVDDSYPTVVSTGYAQLRSNLNPSYLYNLLLTTSFLNKVLVKCTGSNYPAINSSDLSNIQLKVTSNIDEQQKIGEFFSKLDQQIELEEKKLAKLEEQKKGYMQKIFSKELRFKDENGNNYPEWEDKKLLNVIAIQNGYAFKSNLFSEKGMPIIRITDINKSTVKKGTVYYPESIEINERFKIKQYDILIAMSGATTGKVGKYISEKPSLLNQRIGKFVMKKGTDNNFMFTYLNSLYFKKELSKLLVAGAQPNISSQDIENINLFIPNNEEQRKIGEFFNELDGLIEKQSSKIGVLKQRKKGFLQKMFV